MAADSRILTDAVAAYIASMSDREYEDFATTVRDPGGVAMYGDPKRDSRAARAVLGFREDQQ